MSPRIKVNRRHIFFTKIVYVTRLCPSSAMFFATIFITSMLPVHKVKALETFNVTPASSTLTMFGFVGVDCGAKDVILPRTNVNYVDEVGPFSNVGHLCALNPTDSIIPRITTFSSYGTKPILDVSNILYEKIGSQLKLRSDYKSRWNIFLSKNNISLYTKEIAGIYIADEPFWNGLSYASLETGVNLVKKALPTLPIMFIESYVSLTKLRVPTNVSYVGFDHFQVDPMSVGYKNELALLKTKIRSTQKIFLVMEGQWTPASPGSTFPASQYESIIPNYYTLAQSDPRILGMLVYAWPGGIGSSTQYGVRDFPVTTQEIYKAVGRAIARKPN